MATKPLQWKDLIMLRHKSKNKEDLQKAMDLILTHCTRPLNSLETTIVLNKVKSWRRAMITRWNQTRYRGNMRRFLEKEKKWLEGELKLPPFCYQKRFPPPTNSKPLVFPVLPAKSVDACTPVPVSEIPTHSSYCVVCSGALGDSSSLSVPVTEYQASCLYNIFNFETLSSDIMATIRNSIVNGYACSSCEAKLREVESLVEDWENIQHKIRASATEFKKILIKSGILLSQHFPQSTAVITPVVTSSSRRSARVVEPKSKCISSCAEAHQHRTDSPHDQFPNEDGQRDALLYEPSTSFSSYQSDDVPVIQKVESLVKKANNKRIALGSLGLQPSLPKKSKVLVVEKTKNRNPQAKKTVAAEVDEDDFNSAQLAVLCQQFESQNLLHDTCPDDPEKEVREAWRQLSLSVSGVGNCKTVIQCWHRLQSISLGKPVASKTFASDVNRVIHPSPPMSYSSSHQRICVPVILKLNANKQKSENKTDGSVFKLTMTDRCKPRILQREKGKTEEYKRPTKGRRILNSAQLKVLFDRYEAQRELYQDPAVLNLPHDDVAQAWKSLAAAVSKVGSQRSVEECRQRLQQRIAREKREEQLKERQKKMEEKTKLRDREKADENGRPDKTLTCHGPKCQFKSSSCDSLAAHYRRKHLGDSYPYHCNYPACEKKYADAGGLRAHRATHGEKLPFQCQHCHRSFAFTNQLKYHILKKHTENPPKHPCNICNQEFFTERGLRIHTQSHDTNPKQFKCPVTDCLRSYATTYKLQRHLGKAHGDQYPEFSPAVYNQTLMCSECGLTFKKSFLFRRHQLTHQEGIYPEKLKQKQLLACPAPGCRYKSCYEKRLKKHFTYIHETEKTIPCDQQGCNKLFRTDKDKAVHMEFHLGTRVKPKVCRVACPSCGKQMWKYHLKEHIAVYHTAGNKDGYLCPRCGTGFRRKDYLERHSKTYPNCKPKKPGSVECEICSAKVSNMAGLKRHMLLIHTPESRPWVCDTCGKGFPIKMYLTRHVCPALNENQEQPSSGNGKHPGQAQSEPAETDTPEHAGEPETWTSLLVPIASEQTAYFQ